MINEAAEEIFLNTLHTSFSSDIVTSLKFNNHFYFFCFAALINGFLLLLLPLSCIRSLYSHFVCGALLLSAHLLSYYYVNVIDGNDAGAEEEHMVTVSVVETVASSIAHTAVAKQISLLAVHVVIAIVVSCLLQGPQKPLLPSKCLRFYVYNFASAIYLRFLCLSRF